jgi:hypothetical protein
MADVQEVLDSHTAELTGDLKQLTALSEQEDEDSVLLCRGIS